MSVSPALIRRNLRRIIRHNLEKRADPPWGLPSQKFGLAVKIRWLPDCHSLNTNGPAPTVGFAVPFCIVYGSLFLDIGSRNVLGMALVC